MPVPGRSTSGGAHDAGTRIRVAQHTHSGRSVRYPLGTSSSVRGELSPKRPGCSMRS